MFDRLSDGFNSVFRTLSGKGAISEANVREAMEEVRSALLEADVHFEVVEKFCSDVIDDAVGQKVTQSLKPGQEMIGIVHDRLVELLGGADNSADDSAAMAAAGVKVEPKESGTPEAILRVSPGPTVLMMCGLQGSGKTTTCGKLAAYLAKQGRSVMLCAADLQRPAAVEQLETVAAGAAEVSRGKAEVLFYGEPDQCAEYGKAIGVAVKVCQNALAKARAERVDVLILDTAGRLHINDELMGELQRIHKTLSPHHIFLVTDAMTGQDAVNSAREFHQRLNVDGIILTKFDSDTRGGAALSVKAITGAPIKFIGVGEKVDALEVFHPERMAGRILGMGDVLSLVEKAQQEVSEEEAEALQAKMAKGELGMDDFLKQMKMMRRMGPMKQILGMLPGAGQLLKDVDIDDNQFDRVEAQIHSMTPAERSKPSVINPSRRRRIATGSGVEQNEVGQLVKQFDAINKITKQLGGMGGMGGMGGGMGGGQLAAAKQLAQAGMGGGRMKVGTRAGGRGFKKKRK